MSNPESEKPGNLLRWGKQMSPEEEALLRDSLAEAPEEQSFLEEELALNQLLRQLPDAPLDSNFTARVMQQVRRADPFRSPGKGSWLRRLFPGSWLPKFSAAAVLLCIGFFAHQFHQSGTQQEMARSVAALTEMAAFSGFDVLENFEAIERLAQVPHDVDVDLIAALQTFTP
jgi:hypothetical protein